MEFHKRYYRPVALLVIVFAVLFYLDRGFSDTVAPHTEEVAALLGQVDDVIAKIQRNESAEDGESPGKASALTHTGPAEVAVRQPIAQNAPVPEPAVVPGETAGQSGAAVEPNQSAVGTLPAGRLWQEARLAAWQGDPAAAIKLYRRLLAQQPDNFDVYGEMGNVMLSNGDRDGAAEAYYQAALLLNATPHRAMAWHLLNVLSWLAPEKADRLYRELLQQP